MLSIGMFLSFLLQFGQKFSKKHFFFLLRANISNFWREKLFLKGGQFFQERNSFCHELEFSNTYFYETPYIFETLFQT